MHATRPDSDILKQSGKVSIFLPIQGFAPDSVDNLCEELKVNQFSKATLKTWHRLPPKRLIDDLAKLFEKLVYQKLE